MHCSTPHYSTEQYSTVQVFTYRVLQYTIPIMDEMLQYSDKNGGWWGWQLFRKEDKFQVGKKRALCKRSSLTLPWMSFKPRDLADRIFKIQFEGKKSFKNTKSITRYLNSANRHCRRTWYESKRNNPKFTDERTLNWMAFPIDHVHLTFSHHRLLAISWHVFSTRERNSPLSKCTVQIPLLPTLRSNGHFAHVKCYDWSEKGRNFFSLKSLPLEWLHCCWIEGRKTRVFKLNTDFSGKWKNVSIFSFTGWLAKTENWVGIRAHLIS